MYYQTKLNENTDPFYIASQVLNVLTKIFNVVTRSFIFYCFTSAFTSADIIFHNFLERHSALFEKIRPLSYALNEQNLLSVS